MATVTQCWRRRWKRWDSYVTAVVAADAEVKPSSSVASLGALPKHIHCKPEREPLLHPVFLKYVQLYLSRVTEYISNHITTVAEIKPSCCVCCISRRRASKTYSLQTREPLHAVFLKYSQWFLSRKPECISLHEIGILLK